MAEELYEAFAKNPTLDSLQEWLINNDVICVPGIDANDKLSDKQPVMFDRRLNDGGATEKLAPNEVWMRLFISCKDLNEGLLVELRRNYSHQCVEGTIPFDYKAMLAEFQKQLEESSEHYRDEYGEAIRIRLKRSDLESELQDGRPQSEMKAYRREELRKIAGNTNFAEEVKRRFPDMDFLSDEEHNKIAVLVILALLNLRCGEEERNDATSWQYNVLAIGDKDGTYTIIFKDSDALKDVEVDEMCIARNDGLKRSMEHIKEENQNMFCERNEIADGRETEKITADPYFR